MTAFRLLLGSALGVGILLVLILFAVTNVQFDDPIDYVIAVAGITLCAVLVGAAIVEGMNEHRDGDR